MNIVIFSRVHDDHSIAVQRAVKSLGGEASIVDPLKEFSTIELGSVNQETSKSKTSINGELIGSDSLWLRRPFRPIEGGSDALDREITASVMCSMHAASSNASLVVNPINVAIDFESKYRCYCAALEQGFLIPQTLISADVEKIGEQFRVLDGRMVYKPYCQHSDTPIGTFSGTVVVTPAMLNNRCAIARAPGIYQEQLQIDYEVRALVLGRTVVAARIVNKSRFVDSRVMLGSQNVVAPHVLPADVSSACVRLVRDNGLTSASIDIAFTVSGDLYFLDLNPSGQFLWMEYYCEEIPALDTFARFLLSGDEDFVMNRAVGSGRVTLRLSAHGERHHFR